MKPRRFEKELVISEPVTKEDLENTYKAYKPINWKDFVITTILHNFAVERVATGAFESSGVYLLGVEFFPKNVAWHKVRLYMRKLE